MSKLRLRITSANGSVQNIALDQRVVVPTEPGVTYAVVDDESGQPVKDLVLKKQGDALIIEEKGQEVVELDHYYSQSEHPAFVDVGSKDSVGQAVLVSPATPESEGSHVVWHAEGITTGSAGGSEVSPLWYAAGGLGGVALATSGGGGQDHALQKALDQELIKRAMPALTDKTPVRIELPVKNINRTVGAMLSGAVAQRFGASGLPDDTIHVTLNGTAGQSFAAFLAKGVTIELVGEGNDYVGKGLSGGRIIIRPSLDFTGMSNENTIIGNTVLYGATSGTAFLSGVGGERFAVRNSGATAVVEGVGDHGCEYMTGGTVVVLGQTGRNFAAGMSGGIAYVYDVDETFAAHCNLSMVTLEKVQAAAEQSTDEPWHNGQSDDEQLKALIAQHAEYTGSPRAKSMLADWESYRSKFVKVYPNEYRRALKDMSVAEQEKEIA